MRLQCVFAASAIALALTSLPARARSQETPTPAPRPTSIDSASTIDTTSGSDTAAARLRAERAAARRRFRIRFALGFVSSILAHEASHVVAAYAVGGHPSFGFDKARPTIFSGIDATLEPRKQFIFSSAGLTVQTLLDEGILDVPHHRGGSFERGLLAGGIATVLFYITLGRNASVSDVTFMARTSKLSIDQVSLIYGSIAALHTVRIHFNKQYAHFFAAPSAQGTLRVGVRLDTGAP